MASNPVMNIQLVNPAQVLGKRGRAEEAMPVMIDISKPIPYPPTAEVVEALRQRILQLEGELRGPKKQKMAAPAPAPVMNVNALALPAPAPVASGSNAKAEAKTKKTRAKSLFDAIKKAARAEKYQQTTRTIRVEDHFSQADFELVFGTSGVLVQPTATNKPKSAVWIREYENEEDLEDLFGEAWKPDQLKGYQWSRGGLFGKSQKMGLVELKLHNMEVQWSKNTEKATLKIEVSERETFSFGYGW